MVALIFAIGSVTASIFLFYAVAGLNLEVLVLSPLCGLVGLKTDGVGTTYYGGKIADISERYADDCYGDNAIIPSRCNVFVKPRIPFTVENTTCPFSAPNICSSAAVAMDIGLVDFNDDFGLNLVNNERVKYRQRITCAVLD